MDERMDRMGRMAAGMAGMSVADVDVAMTADIAAVRLKLDMGKRRSTLLASHGTRVLDVTCS